MSECKHKREVLSMGDFKFCMDCGQQVTKGKTS